MADPLSMLSKKKKEEEPKEKKKTSLSLSTPDEFATAHESLVMDVDAVLGEPERFASSNDYQSPSPASEESPRFNNSSPRTGTSSQTLGREDSFGFRNRGRDTDDPKRGEKAANAAREGISALAGAFSKVKGEIKGAVKGGGGGGHGHSRKDPGPPPTPPSGADVPSGTSFEDILVGERVVAIVKVASIVVTNPLCELRGRILVTNYRFKFQMPKNTLREELFWMRDAGYFDLVMGTIEDISEERKQNNMGNNEIRLKVATKDLRSMTMVVASDEDVRNIMDAYGAFGIPGNPTLLFAFKHAEAYWAAEPQRKGDNGGWTLYDPLREYARLGVDCERLSSPNCPWKLSTINQNYELCTSYPTMLAFPRKMSEGDLRAVAGFRKRGRLPAMSWCGGPDLDYASLWRCSQTTEGLMGQKCFEDQKMVECIRQGSRSQADRDLLLIDLRPWKSAWANKAGGGGFEGYPRCRLIFGGIDNIHCVRDAWRAMGAAVANVNDENPGTWLKDVANSLWYDYIGAILSVTSKIVKEIIDAKCSVMVHCSDGWDRTAQATSLSMLCMDPTYRTQQGLLKLIQKEWCSFGHQFRTRLALGEVAGHEFSPIFIQLLECIYQLCVQHPNAFEFTPNILLRLGTEAMTNKYGTFLCDNERERNQKVMPFAVSFWEILMRPEDAATWRNPNYNPNIGCIYPLVSQANYEVWNEYWWRYHPRGQKFKVGVSPPSFGVQSGLPPPGASSPRLPDPGQAMMDSPPLEAPAERSRLQDLSEEGSRSIDVGGFGERSLGGSSPTRGSSFANGASSLQEDSGDNDDVPDILSGAPKRPASRSVFEDEDDVFTLKPKTTPDPSDETKSTKKTWNDIFAK